MARIDDIRIQWVASKKDIDLCLKMMYENTNGDYATVEDLKCGRLTVALQWKSNFAEIVNKELKDPDSGYKMGMVTYDNSIELIGMFIVRVDYILCFGELVDIIVGEKFRSIGIGKEIMKWLEDEFKRIGLKNILLSSGINNLSAHKFFNKIGFRQYSIDFLKSI